MQLPASCPHPGEVQIWHAHIDDAWATAAGRTYGEAWLQPDERVRHRRFRRESDRRMFLLGRVMARLLVGRALGVEPSAWPWHDGSHGRPEVGLADCRLSFNLAHSGGVVVCALGTDTEVGVDVEDRGRAPLDPQLVARYCSPDEQSFVAVDGRVGWQDRFLQLWTLKEAYLKARGLGLTVHLADLSFTLAGQHIRLTCQGELAAADPRWVFSLTTLGDRHYVAAAASATSSRPVFSLRALPQDLAATPP
jgi:4'-phosphopantetheinyl transferase